MTPLQRARAAAYELWDGVNMPSLSRILAAAVSDEDEMEDRVACLLDAEGLFAESDMNEMERTAALGVWAAVLVADLRSYLLDVSAEGARVELPPPAPRVPSGDTTTRGDDDAL